MPIVLVTPPMLRERVRAHREILGRAGFEVRYPPHTPVTEETRGMINRETLSRMKPTAYLINTARGELVDEEALAEALRERRIAGAGLDVFHREPPVDSPLRGLDNVLYSPHIAGIDEQSVEAMAAMAAEAVVTVLQGGTPPVEQVVNPLYSSPPPPPA